MASYPLIPTEDKPTSRLDAVLESVSEPIAITNLQGKVLRHNQAASRFFGPVNQTGERTRWMLESNLQKVAQVIAAAPKGERRYVKQVTLTPIEEGESVPLQAVCTSTLENDTSSGFVVVFRESKHDTKDVTAALEELRAAERVARQDRDRLNRVLEKVGDPIIVADNTAKILSFDPLARQLFDDGGEIDQSQLASNRAKLNAYLAAFTFSFLDRQDKAIHFYDPKTRNETEYSARSGKIYDEDGRLAYTVTVLRDFSSWKTVERSQLERRMLEMEKFAATGKLAGTIAHEINNPMEAIKNAIYLLKDRLDPASKPIYDALKSETDRVTRIVRQMLGLYRKAGHVGDIDINVIVEDTLTLFSRPLEKSGIQILKQLGNLPRIKGSADQFRQLLSNLVVNSADSMPEGGKLTVKTSYAKSIREGYGLATILVADTGSGIPEEVRHRMFHPFVTTKGEKGTGLGLWIVKGIVESHGGRIYVRSTVGRGTVFKLVFPVSEGRP
jgi:signal transduction histidine kinase